MNAPWYSKIAVGIFMSVVIIIDMTIATFIHIKGWWEENW